MNAMLRDPLLRSLADLRPSLDEEASSPRAPAALAVFERALRESRPGWSWPRLAVPVGLAMMVLAVTGALLMWNTVPAPGPVQTRILPQTDITLVSARSEEAMARSGRARISYVSNEGSVAEMRVDGLIEFTGKDVAMRLKFAGVHGRPGFVAENRTVDGHFYLLDGVPGQQRWIHDVGATTGGDPFSIDPRNLLKVLDPSADFETVDVDGDVRHLRARSLDDIPEMNLGLGPSSEAEVTNLELWVGSDDIVQRLDFTYDITEDLGGPMYVKDENGNRKRFTPPSGTPDSHTYSSSYSVVFFDVGAAIKIEAPADAVEVNGQG